VNHRGVLIHSPHYQSWIERGLHSICRSRTPPLVISMNRKYKLQELHRKPLRRIKALHIKSSHQVIRPYHSFISERALININTILRVLSTSSPPTSLHLQHAKHYTVAGPSVVPAPLCSPPCIRFSSWMLLRCPLTRP